MAKATKKVAPVQSYRIEHQPVPEGYVPFNSETVEQFLEADGVEEIVEVDEEGNVTGPKNNFAVLLDPRDVILETQPEVRTEGSGLGEDVIADLAASLADVGQIQPGVVRIFLTPEKTIQFHLAAGLRRTIAGIINTQSLIDQAVAEDPNVDQSAVEPFYIQYMVQIMDDAACKALALSENTVREGLSNSELSNIIAAALKETRGNQSKAAEKLSGVNRATINMVNQILKATATDPVFDSIWKSNAVSIESAVSLAGLEPDIRAAAMAAMFKVEAVKAEAVLEEVAAGAAAAGEDPVAAVTAAKANATKLAAAGKTSMPSRSPISNVTLGKVAGSTVATAITAAKEAGGNVAATTAAAVAAVAPKAKARSSASVAGDLAEEFTPLLYGPFVVSAIIYLNSYMKGELDDFQLVVNNLRNAFKPEQILPQNVVATAGKPKPLALPKKVAAPAAPVAVAPAPAPVAPAPAPVAVAPPVIRKVNLKLLKALPTA